MEDVRTMLGQVNRPGSYEMPDGSPEGIDLLEAIAMAKLDMKNVNLDRVGVLIGSGIGSQKQQSRFDSSDL